MKIVGSPDGGLYSTAEDLSAFWRGIFDLKLFSQTTLHLFTQFYSNEIEDWGEEWYCLGVKGKDCNGTKVFYHDGWVHGVSFITMYCPETGYVASILGNINVDIFNIESDLMDLVAEGIGLK